MKKASKQILRNIFLIIIVASVIIGCAFYFYQARTFEENSIHWIPFEIESDRRFLVYNSKCRIPDLEPWSKDGVRFYKKKPYKTCSENPLLTKIEKTDDHVFLVYNKAAEKHYCNKPITCCFSNVTKGEDDDHEKISSCVEFKDKVEIYNDVVIVKCDCQKIWNKRVYTNSHAVTFVTEEFKERKKKFGKLKPPSILFVGIDSISRLNFIRTLPQTHKYMRVKRWIGYDVYNKVGLNTFPNLMAVLTGSDFNTIMKISSPYKNVADVYDIIWKDLRRLGYVTAYAEDLADINTFNYLKKGFREKPTDFYFRHYTQVTDNLDKKRLDGIIYCAGPETYGERILNIARDFTFTFIDQPNFGFFWMNSFSHDEVSAPTRMDEKIAEFFQDLENKGVMNNTVIIFLSDHGIRFGDIRNTPTGWLEERMPFLYLWVPRSFRDNYYQQYKNLVYNSRRLTTPFDLYMTVQDILVLYGLNYTIKPSVSCPKCGSFFGEIEDVRSCEDAAIGMDWCTCISYKHIDPTSTLIIDIANFVIKETEKSMALVSPTAARCAPLKLRKVLRSRISDTQEYWYKNITYIMVVFETIPKVTLEAVVGLETRDNVTKFRIQGQVNRIDLYRDTSGCVELDQLKKYCYCKDQLSWIRRWLNL